MGPIRNIFKTDIRLPDRSFKNCEIASARRPLSRRNSSVIEAIGLARLTEKGFRSAILSVSLVENSRHIVSTDNMAEQVNVELRPNQRAHTSPIIGPKKAETCAYMPSFDKIWVISWPRVPKRSAIAACCDALSPARRKPVKMISTQSH